MMFCYNCGNQLKDGDCFCEKCGVPVNTTAEARTAEEPAEEPMMNEPVAEPTVNDPVSAAEEAAPAVEPAFNNARTQSAPDYTVQRPEPEESKLMGVLSLVCGIGSFILGWIPFLMFVPEVLAVIFGIVGIVKKQGRAMAIAGLVLAVLGFIATVFMSLLICVLLLTEFGTEFAPFYFRY